MTFVQPISEEIFRKKYMINGETSPDQVFGEVADEISSIENGDIREKVREEFFTALNSGELIPGGRILANARPYSKLKNYNNCYTIDIEDSMEGIYNSLKEDAIISKSGGGVGFNISKIRPKGDILSKGGEASGAISFLRVFNESAKIIMTGGSRRSAHISVLNVDHPDIEEFITVKHGDQNKELTQFNISVGITDKFIKAVEEDLDWDLVFNGKVYKTIKAKYLYDLIANNAFIHNEPGIFNLDIVNKYNNGYYGFKIEECNPCGEICCIGSTIINTNKGLISLKELIDRFNNKENIKVLSVNNQGVLELSSVVWGDRTGINKQLIEVELSNGKILKITPNHKIFISPTETLTALEYLQLWEHLTKRNKKRGEYPHPVYLNRSMSNEHYIKIKASTEVDYRLEHRFIVNENRPEYDVHHKDENTLNNTDSNLESLLHSEHSRISNSGHDNYLDGRSLKKSILKHHGDIYNSNTIKDIRWGRTEDVYDITVEFNHNFFAEGILVHNCMPAYSLCCLASNNLTMFVRNAFEDNAYFDYEQYKKAIHTGVRFLDNVLSVTDYPLQKIKDLSLLWRRIGLGFTGLANAMSMLGCSYGDEQSKTLSNMIGMTLRDESYIASTLLAKEKGSFPMFKEKEILDSNFIRQLPEPILNNIKRYGLRNIALNTVAPNGTISLSVGNNCSSGIEPMFSLSYDRNIRTGRKDDTKKESVFDYAFLLYQEWCEKTGKELSKEEFDKRFVTTQNINPYDGVDIQAIFQKYIDHSISKTSNLPVGYSFEEYKQLFMYAYKAGLKGFTSFNPEGSIKPILEYKKEEAKEQGSSPILEKELDIIERSNAPKRPEELPCDIHILKVKEEKFLILIGKYNGSLYEVFITNLTPEHSIDTLSYKEGTLKKNGKGNYSLVVKNGVEKMIVESIGKTFNKDYESLSRLVSTSLRHGVPLEFIVEQLNKNTLFNGFVKSICRVLKKYIKEGEKVKSSIVCPECGGEDTMIYKEGCVTCTCGWAKC